MKGIRSGHGIAALRRHGLAPAAAILPRSVGTKSPASILSAWSVGSILSLGSALSIGNAGKVLGKSRSDFSAKGGETTWTINKPV